jgi:hypothetical protein
VRCLLHGSKYPHRLRQLCRWRSVQTTGSQATGGQTTGR